MVGIRLRNVPIFAYQFFLFHDGSIKELSDLTKLSLGPGEYQLVISGNRSNSVLLTYFTETEVGPVSNDNNYFVPNAP